MTIALILFFGILTVLIGRWMFGKWFNHVGLYGAIWSSSLALFYVGLIDYYPLETETWMIIIAGWLAFVLGSITVLGARYALPANAQKITGKRTGISPTEHSLLLRTLWIVNVVVAADAAHQVYIVGKLVGNISNILALGNLLYSFRVHEGIPGAIPYLGSITLTACLLAGSYTSVVGKLKLVAIVPVLAVIIISITNMGRALIVIGAILFVTGYFLNTIRLSQGSGASTSKFKRALMVVFVAAVLVSGMEVVRGNRGMIEGFAGATTTLRKLGVGAGSFLTPSIVMYATAHHGVLNQYLKKGTENPPIGNYSLAPLWRVLSKVGFDTHVAQHQPFYSIPMNANTGSYLRELHADYGMAGVVFGPFFLGLLATFLWVRYEASHALSDLIILGHIYVVVGMSLVVFAAQLGYWLASLIFGLLLSFAYTRALRARERTKNQALVYA